MTTHDKLALIQRMALEYMGGVGPLADPESIAELLRKAHARWGFTPADVEALS